MMEIHIEKPFLILKEFQLLDLPDFVVITGENGSGKTQLLNYLHFDPMMNTGMNPEMNPMMNPGMNPNGTQSKPAYIKVDGEIITNISSVGVNQHQYNFGQNNNEVTFIKQYGGLPIKYFSFLNLIRLKKPITSESLISQFKIDVGYQNNNNNNFNPQITQNDIDLFQKLYDLKVNKHDGVSFEECIVHLPNIKSQLFSSNLTFLYFQYHNRLKLGLETKEAPWKTFNAIVEAADFKYRLKEPKYNDESIECKIKLLDTENENVIDVNMLSSGERTIMSLLLALYNSKTDTQFPQVLLLDEPDSSLHPSMTQQMLDVLQNVFVKEKGVKVIMTTHSPSTIALTPEISIYRMDRKLGRLVKEEKGKAIKSLTKGLNSLSVYYENRKNVFVESKVDQYYFEQIYNTLNNLEKLDKDLILEFIPTGNEKNKNIEGGGSTTVRSITNSLSKNESIFGLIDFDNSNNGNKKIFILGNKNRYSIENYIFDPIYIALFMLIEKFSERIEIGWLEQDSIRNINDFNSSKFQGIINNLLKKIIESVDEKFTLDNTTTKTYKLVNGMEIEIPEWYYKTPGHFLEKAIENSFPKFKSYKEKRESALKRKFIDKVITEYPEFIQDDVLNTLINLQKANT